VSRVIVYSQPGCGACRAEKDWLSQQGVAFEDRDIRAKPEWLQEIRVLGSQATPTTVVETEWGREVVIGFDRALLSKLLGL